MEATKTPAKNTLTTNSKSINTTKAISQSDLLRQKILSAATPEFRDMYKAIAEKQNETQLSIFETQYAIGALVETMHDDEHTYGSRSVERMDQILGMGTTAIYNSFLFHRRYTEAEKNELLDARNKVGSPLTWTHVTHLIRVIDKKQRKELQDLALENNLTSAELLSYVHKIQGRTAPTGAGKPMARPKTIKAFIEQQTAAIENILKRKSKVWAGAEKPGDKSFLDMLEDAPDTEIDNDIIDEIKELEQLYETASLELDNMATELLRIRARFEKPKASKSEEGDDDEDEEETEEQESEESTDEDEAADPAPRRSAGGTGRAKQPVLD